MCEMYKSYHPTNQSKVRLLVHDCVFFYAETKPGIVQLLGDQTKPKVVFMRFTPGMHGWITHQSVFSYSLNQIAFNRNSHLFCSVDRPKHNSIKVYTPHSSAWWIERNLNKHICWLTVANPRFQRSTRCQLWHVFVGNSERKKHPLLSPVGKGSRIPKSSGFSSSY